MSNSIERVTALSPEKQALLLQRLRQKSNQSPTRSAQASSQSLDGWIVRTRPNENATMRLFCFPYAGGSASVFRQWVEFLPSDIEICSIQLPGRENRIGETAYKRMPELLDGLTAAITPYLDKPFAFFGHSMGALVSFALTRRLRETMGKAPVRLYLAAYRAAHLPNPNIKIYHLPSEVFKVVLRADGIPETILQNEELMQAMLPTLRSDFELCDTYVHQDEAPLDCPVTIYGGLEDVRVGAVDLDAWRTHFTAGFTIKMFPGSHFFLHSAQDQLLAELAKDLQGYLDEARSTQPIPA